VSRVEHLSDDATLYLGDCREIIPAIGKVKVDAVITDPPYFLPVQSYVGKRGEGYSKRMIGDVSVLEGYFDGIFAQMEPLLSAGATYYVFCDAKSYPVFWRVLFPRCNHVRLVIWDKMVSYNGYTWRHQHELIAWGECEGAERVPTGDGDVISIRGVLQEDRFHPAEKPAAIIERLVEKLPLAAAILDPFMGSGTTGVACASLGRKFVGIEIEPKYFDIACRRISDELKRPRLPFEEAKKPVQETMFT
jgi:site-specific DNA-methyltransferase (adenine-specific)